MTWRRPSLGSWIAAAFLLMAFPVRAAEIPIGEPVVKEGMRIAARLVDGAEMDRKPGGMSLARDAILLECAVTATAEESHGFAAGAFIPYLSVSYALGKEGAPTFRKAGLLYPVAGQGGPRYAAFIDPLAPGSYRLTYIISPPSAHGLLRRTGKTGGVPDWWRPITINWTFTVPDTAPTPH